VTLVWKASVAQPCAIAATSHRMWTSKRKTFVSMTTRRRSSRFAALSLTSWRSKLRKSTAVDHSSHHAENTARCIARLTKPSVQTTGQGARTENILFPIFSRERSDELMLCGMANCDVEQSFAAAQFNHLLLTFYACCFLRCIDVAHDWLCAQNLKSTKLGDFCLRSYWIPQALPHPGLLTGWRRGFPCSKRSTPIRRVATRGIQGQFPPLLLCPEIFVLNIY